MRSHLAIATVALGAIAIALALVALPDRPAPKPQQKAAAPSEPERRLLAELEGGYGVPPRPTGRTHELTIEAAPVSLPLLDGDPLEVWAYDGRVPGPVIRIRRGDRLRATLVNRLPQATTIHWHGVRVPNAMDGVPHVTQPPVEPGQSFTYDFVPPDAGTFWFHPHVRGSEQVERGLFGVLIVEDESPPPYSRELLWVVDDWRLGADGQIAPEFNTRHDLAHDGRWGQVITVNGERLPEVELRPGERVRLRLLNVANGRVFRLDFGGLDTRGIAVDGLYARAPFDATGFELAPGNRLDLDVVVPASLRGRELTVVDRFTRRVNPVARVRVADTEPVPTPELAPMRNHVPVWADADGVAPHVLHLNARRGGPFGIAWTINDVAFHHEAHGQHGPIFRLPRERFARIVFANDSARIHPMHLHGTFFKVLRRGGRPVDEPFFRDTVLVHGREQVEVGLVPLDEGTWMMHCHILEHAEAGMMTLFAVDP